VNGTRGRILGVASLSLRPGGPDDAETLFAIHRESVLVAYTQIFPPDRYAFPEAEMRRHWVERLSDAEVSTMIAESETVTTGFAVVSPGWLESMFVLPRDWGRGVGSALHDKAVELLRAKGAGGRLWVLEQNEQARGFYERRGWRHDGERQRSNYPPYPPVLRYVLEPGGTPDPSQAPTHPRGFRG
jgi:GNAT superfamily N-acetyltransferase